MVGAAHVPQAMTPLLRLCSAPCHLLRGDLPCRPVYRGRVLAAVVGRQGHTRPFKCPHPKPWNL